MARWRLQFVKYWVFAKNSIFWVPISLQPDFSNVDFNLIEFIVWNYTTSGCKGKWSLWQKIMIFFRFRKVICWSIDCLIDWLLNWLIWNFPAFKWHVFLTLFPIILHCNIGGFFSSKHFTISLSAISQVGVNPRVWRETQPYSDRME